jgi:cell division protein FtsW
MGFVMVILIMVAPYRLERITGFLNPHAQASAASYQPTEGRFALGSGGWFGVGLGASREKWGWVPNAPTDFIFAILGEELGLIGTLCVAVLYGGLAYAGCGSRGVSPAPSCASRRARPPPGSWCRRWSTSAR